MIEATAPLLVCEVLCVWFPHQYTECPICLDTVCKHITKGNNPAQQRWSQSVRRIFKWSQSECQDINNKRMNKFTKLQGVLAQSKSVSGVTAQSQTYINRHIFTFK